MDLQFLSNPEHKAVRMILKVVIDDQTYPVRVPEDIVREGEEFFSRIDEDMDKGWQMSRDWVDNPDQLMVLLSAYILARVPGVQGIRIDTNGEMLESELFMD